MKKILVLRGCKILGKLYDENTTIEVDAATALEFVVHGCGRYVVASDAPPPRPMTMTRETASAPPAAETATLAPAKSPQPAADAAAE